MIGVVAHDPGGAEIVSSYIRRENLSCGFALAGPAEDIFSRKLGSFQNLSLEDLIVSCDWFLCGTSKYSILEWQAFALARALGKRSVAMLDHWVGYRERFVRDGIYHFPDEVWVGDRFAAAIADENLPEVERKLVPNAYFEDVRREIAEIQAPLRGESSGTHILYVCEPLHEDARLYCGYNEEDAVRYFLAHVECLADNIEKIILRPHPREELGKYRWVLGESNLPIVISKSEALIKQIADSDIVAGCTTMAMVTALEAGKRVVSCIPPGARIEPLPYLRIEKIQTLLEVRAIKSDTIG